MALGALSTAAAALTRSDNSRDPSLPRPPATALHWPGHMSCNQSHGSGALGKNFLCDLGKY